MSKHDRSNDDISLNDRLAAYTDRLLEEGKEDTEMVNQTQDIKELQETVVFLKKYLVAARPDKELDKRIRNRLQQEWKRANVIEDKIPLSERLRQVFRGTGPRLALAVATTLALVLVVITLVKPGDETGMTGTAGNAQQGIITGQWLFPAAVVVILLGIFIATVLGLRKKP